MRLVLEILALGTLIAFALTYAPIWAKRLRARRAAAREVVPTLEGRLRAYCGRDERLTEALEIRDRIAGYAAREEVGLDPRLIVDVDTLIAGMVALDETARELGRHLDALPVTRLARDAALLDGDAAARQARQIEALRQKRASLEGELVRAVAGLREAWLGLIDALSRPDVGSPVRVAREQVEALNLRVSAEREARAVEVEHA